DTEDRHSLSAVLIRRSSRYRHVVHPEGFGEVLPDLPEQDRAFRPGKQSQPRAGEPVGPIEAQLRSGADEVVADLLVQDLPHGMLIEIEGGEAGADLTLQIEVWDQDELAGGVVQVDHVQVQARMQTAIALGIEIQNAFESLAGDVSVGDEQLWTALGEPVAELHARRNGPAEPAARQRH